MAAGEQSGIRLSGGEGSFCTALGDWEENEASVSCSFHARSCKSWQHCSIRMSRNALGEYSEVQATKSAVFQAVFWLCGDTGSDLKCKRGPCEGLQKWGILHWLFLLWSLYSDTPALADSWHFGSFIFTQLLWYPLHRTLSTYHACSQIHSVFSLSKYVVQILTSLGYFLVSWYINLCSGYLPFYCLNYSQANPQLYTLFYSLLWYMLDVPWCLLQSAHGDFIRELWPSRCAEEDPSHSGPWQRRTQSKWEFVKVCLCSVSLAPALLTVFPKSCCQQHLQAASLFHYTPLLFS